MMICKDSCTNMLGYGLDKPWPLNKSVTRNELFNLWASRGAQMILVSSIGDYTADISNAIKEYNSANGTYVCAAISGMDARGANFNPWQPTDYEEFNKSNIMDSNGVQVEGTGTGAASASWTAAMVQLK